MATLRELIAAERPVVAPSIYDGISARLVSRYKFPAAYIGSYATSATKYGMPDTGFIALSDMADQVRRLSGIVDIPLIVDGEGGWGNPVHAAHAVRELERAGAAAVHIEDHVFGKHLGPQQVLPVEEAVKKIQAAAEAKRSDDFMVIARSDAVAVEGIEATVDRLLEYERAGADALFVASTDIDDSLHPRLVESANVPLVVVNDRNHSAAEHGERGASVVLYFAVTHFAAEAAIDQAFRALAETGSTTDVEKGFKSLEEFDQLLGVEEVAREAQRFGAV